MMRASAGRPVFGGLLVVIGLAFCLPLHLYPLPNYIEELLVALGVVASAGWLLWRANAIRFSVWSLAWAVLGLLFVLSSVFHESAFAAGKAFYLVFWFVGALTLLIADQIDWGNGEASLLLAWVLLVSAMICAVGGFLRHYGLLWSGVNAFVPMVDAGRMVGMIGHSNFFAYVCLIGVLAAGWLFQVRRLHVGWLAPIVLFLILCLIFSGSRSALVAWGALAGLLLLLCKRVPANRFVVVVFAGFVALWALQPVAGVINHSLLANISHAAVVDERLFALGGRGMDSSGRLLEWKVALELFREHFWFGIGIGNYAGASYAKHVALGFPSLAGVFMHSHNSPLQLAVEFGVAGVVWILLVGILAVRGFWQGLADPGRLLPLSILLVFAVYALFEFPYWLMHFLALNLLVTGALGGGVVQWSLRLGKLFALILFSIALAVSVIYVPLVERFYWSYRQYLVRTPVSASEYGFMNSLVSDPLMEPYGYLIYFANFQMSPGSLAMERGALERFQRYLPYAPLMARLAFVEFAMGDEDAGRKTVEEMRVFFGGGADGYLNYQRREAERSFPEKDFSALLLERSGH